LGISLVQHNGYYLRMDTGVSAPLVQPVELRAAVRFPLRIKIAITTEAGEVSAMTVNISANGILCEELAEPLTVGSPVSFTIPMPAEAMGTPSDVVVRCVGRVVRCTKNESGWQAAAVIDKYYFGH
jgi:PilZ domain